MVDGLPLSLLTGTAVMTRRPLARWALSTVAVALLAGVAVVARQAPPPTAPMAAAAAKFLAGLDDKQKAKATFTFDDPHREKWYFTPQQANGRPTRKGVRLDELTADQKTAAMDLLKAGLSARGYDQATTIMSLESVLADLEKNGGNVRKSDWYFVSVFGDPSTTGAWGWRIEGHHLSVNFTLDKGAVVAATPLLFASNPADVREGPRKGLRTLPEIEDLAKELIASLTPDQDALARQAKQFPEIKEGQPNAAVGRPVGVPAAKLSDAQKATLKSLTDAYADRLPTDVAQVEKRRVADAGADAVYFGYCRDDAKKGKPYTYRVQGPTFVVEFLNVQADSAGNPANHIHSGWRRLPIDFAVGGK